MKSRLSIPFILMLVGCEANDSVADQSATAPVETANSVAAQGSETPGANRQARDAEESRPPNAEWQEPAFPDQTRAPKPADSENWSVETVTSGLEHPWAVAILPDGSLLVTERPGRLRRVSRDGRLSEPIAGVPEVHARGQGGLLDVALAPDFVDSRRIYLSYAEPRDGGSGTTLATGTLSAELDAISDLQVIFRQRPDWNSRGHFGSRIVFAEDGTLFLTLGDRMDDEARHHAQDASDHLGTVVRIKPDGSVPDDNPFVDGDAGAPEVWSYGHRNIQAADLHPDTGALWTIEHGPRGGDELNQPQAGRNYGWPVISYGIEYRGSKIGEGRTEQDGMEQPVYYWDPVIAPSGMTFYTGEAFPAWHGDLFVGGLATERVVRLVMEDGRVVAEEWLPIGERVRDVEQGPDGQLYLVTDERDGKLMRIVPEG